MNARCATTFVDCLFLIAMVLLLLPHGREEGDPPILGRVAVSIEWGDAPVDVDLWVSDPAGYIVKYNHRQSGVAALLRDDLGRYIADAPHTEVAVVFAGRGGRFRVQAHGYGPTNFAPVEVRATLYERRGAYLVPIWTGAVVVGYQQLVDVVEWRMQDGEIVPGSIEEGT